MNHILEIMEFIEKLGISVENLEISYDEMGQFFFYGKEKKEDEFFERLVSAKLEEEKESITIKETIRHEYNFKPFWRDGKKEQSYNVEITTDFAKWKVKKPYLNLYTTTVFQTTKEDTLGGRIQPLVDFDSMTDFLDQEKISMATRGSSYLPIERIRFLVPDDYHITEGLSQIKELSESIVLKK